MKGKIAFIDLSSGQLTDEGELIARMHHHGILKCLLLRDEYSISVYNGGIHSFSLHLDTNDLFAFFDLLNNIYGDSAYMNAYRSLRKRAGL